MARWEKRLKSLAKDAKLRIGIAWSGRLDFGDNYLRSIPFEKLEPLLKIPRIQFFSLQVGEPASQIKGDNIIDLSSELTDFAETAAVMEVLDLVITSDTSVVHLAAALGQPTWLLLHYAPDWRWGSEGSSSPWYPSARLFRQDENRSWERVIEIVKGQVESLCMNKIPRQALNDLMTKAATS